MTYSAPSALEDFEYEPMPTSIPPTPSPLGAVHRMSLNRSMYSSPRANGRNTSIALLDNFCDSRAPDYVLAISPPTDVPPVSDEIAWQAALSAQHRGADIISLGCVQAGTGQTVPVAPNATVPPLLEFSEFDVPPGIFVIPPPPAAPPQLAHCAHERLQMPPPPVAPPQFLPHGFAEVPSVPVHLAPQEDRFGDSSEGPIRSVVSDSMRSLAQQISWRLTVTKKATESIKVKNTFIHDDSQQRSPSLERVLQRRRQAQSCPGSKLPTPRGSRPSSRLPTPRSDGAASLGLLNFEEPEVVSSNASTADATETMFDSALPDKYHKYQTLPGRVPSVQFAAWNTAPRDPPILPGNSEHHNSGLSVHRLQPQRTLLADGQGTASQVLQLESVLTFGDDACVADHYGDASFAEREVSLAQPSQLGSPELPSVGSVGHHIRRCKPCAFMTRQGCVNGMQCKFCHLCGAGEKKRRRKEKRALMGAARTLAAAGELPQQ